MRNNMAALALIVSHDGHRVLEHYSHGASMHQPLRIYSGTKAFWSVAAAKAQQKRILSLSEKASFTLPAWRNSPKQGITLRELLNMTSGLFPAPVLHGTTIADRNEFALRLPLASKPGETFRYGPASLQVFDEVMEHKLIRRGQTTRRFLESEILRPLGIPLRRHLSDRTGSLLQASGFTLTAREWQRWGECLANGGRSGFWSVIRRDTLAACLEGSRANPMYGLGFWLNAGAKRKNAREIDVEQNLSNALWPSNGCLSRHAPADLFVSLGSLGQRLYVIPSRKLVIVRLGNKGGFSDAAFLKLLFGPEEPKSNGSIVLPKSRRR